MPVRQISKHCLQIKRFNSVNCYLVRDTDGLTLVDTALAAARIIREAARQLGEPIRRVVLTHAHLDHVGSLDEVKKLVPDIRILAGSRESQIFEEAARGVKPGRMTLRPAEPQSPVKGSFKKLKNLPETLLNEGDSIGSLRVVNSPGHTPGHISLFDGRDGSLYAGDALTTMKQLRLPFDPPWYFPLPKWATWHNETALASAERFSNFDLARILPGHGSAVENPREALEHAISQARRQLGK